ncbi:hypothetical protein FQN57_006040 [Myotisia sp. PD_48]|nr:hypothetical protein FQN57_006040 [Myotisia sp. PD_48]
MTRTHSFYRAAIHAFLISSAAKHVLGAAITHGDLRPRTLPGWTYLGCYTDSVGGRTLGQVGVVDGGPSNMSVDGCQAGCFSAGYIYAGVEYSGECWCDNAIRNGAGPAPDGEARCNMPCHGNSAQMCGGPDRLNLYKYGTTTTTTSAPTTTTTEDPTTTEEPTTTSTDEPTTEEPTVTSTDEPTTEPTVTPTDDPTSTVADPTTTPDEPTSTPTDPPTSTEEPTATDPTDTTTEATATTSDTPTGTGTGIPADWSYAGCYVDGIDGRIMAHQLPDSDDLTIESCIAGCLGAGYTVAGLQYTRQCFCDYYVRNESPLTSDSECSMQCSGDATQDCGGPNRMSVYSKGDLVVLPNPVPQTGGLPGSWKYQGCLQDNVNQKRVFPYQIVSRNNTATNCLSRCSMFGFGAGGMQYGEECFCGDYDDIAKAGAQFVPEDRCDMVCSGNATSICGAGNLITLYKWTGTPLQKFHYPSGAEAGRYEFLIGGVVVALMTTVGINGKITFQEKFGTGTPNTTGAYEFDPAFDNDFSKAWRPMHVETDMFCAGGLVLPDKAGRQMTVGGWSGISTYGIRLYLPDGSPGQPSVNDWQEDPSNLLMQNGRWYPSAMIMPNGSILIVGGEEGANAAAVPTLELLPKVGPVLYMDWLQRTDPYNLYPFMTPLPSGGIFIQYYNEARVLSETDFSTVKTLPKTPGAVHNDDGGRTYPLEGTMMIFPQHAPYTEPLGVIFCGGSTPFQGHAIDNCVSMRPEVDTKWTIERMPSRRVLTCMAALPDGTFLILNGAKVGVAGFGLAKIPNLNAVLYDPYKPVNQRMSVMGNTTIARMYHSEALLMPDGRVLVTGSDPQDAEYPQEYRVEVFLPPYLTSGAARPTFTIQDKDWEYSQPYTIQITSGSTANLRVSLMGMVSTTHGNSYGSRTIFPEVSCTGNTCTIIAPPDSNVCPPGWFMLYVLDGPTPSVASFVRIGGDPARLGDWPPIEGFNLPGV